MNDPSTSESLSHEVTLLTCSLKVLRSNPCFKKMIGQFGGSNKLARFCGAKCLLSILIAC